MTMSANTTTAPSRINSTTTTTAKPLTAKQLAKQQHKEQASIQRLHQRISHAQLKGNLSLQEIHIQYDPELLTLSSTGNIVESLNGQLQADGYKQLGQDANLPSQLLDVWQQPQRHHSGSSNGNVSSSNNVNTKQTVVSHTTTHSCLLPSTIELYRCAIDLSALVNERRVVKQVNTSVASCQHVIYCASAADLHQLVLSRSNGGDNNALLQKIQHMLSLYNNSVRIAMLILLQDSTSTGNNRSSTNSNSNSKATPLTSSEFLRLEDTLTCISLICNAFVWRIFSSVDELCSYAVRVVKTVSKTPYKLRPQQQMNADGNDENAAVDDNVRIHDSLYSVPTGRTMGMKGGDRSVKRVRATLHEQYICYLMAIPQMSEDRARAIVNAYPTFHQLMRAYARCDSTEQRMNMLADIKVGDRRLGVLSQKVYHCLYGNNPNAPID